jgi:hypothetical protein
MNPLQQLAEIVLRLTQEGLVQLINFLRVDGEVNRLTDQDVRNIALQREGWEVDGEYYFGKPDTCGVHVANVLKAARDPEVGVEKTLAVLEDALATLQKLS